MTIAILASVGPFGFTAGMGVVIVYSPGNILFQLLNELGSLLQVFENYLSEFYDFDNVLELSSSFDLYARLRP